MLERKARARLGVGLYTVSWLKRRPTYTYGSRTRYSLKRMHAVRVHVTLPYVAYMNRAMVITYFDLDLSFW